MKPVGIVGAAAFGRHGTGWRALGEAALVASHGTYVKLSGMPDETPLANPRARKMMSRGAYLAARCLSDLLADVTWRRANVGYFLGVGASGGSLDDVTALLDASIVDGEFSLERFGDRGLAACNPLLAFQLMNNFTLCHGAILEGIGGPNAAVFSRGAGTTAALIEAMHAIGAGDCDHAIAGGADSAVHPVTHAELVREGFVAQGQVPAEGAALLALGVGDTGARTLAVIEGAAIANGTGRPVLEVIDDAVERATRRPDDRATSPDHGTASRDRAGGCPAPRPDLIVVAPWGPPIADALRTWASRYAPRALFVDVSIPLGDTLAASPALAWVAAIDLLVDRTHGNRALVISAGVDGDIGAALFTAGDA